MRVPTLVKFVVRPVVMDGIAAIRKTAIAALMMQTSIAVAPFWLLINFFITALHFALKSVSPNFDLVCHTVDHFVT